MQKNQQLGLLQRLAEMQEYGKNEPVRTAQRGFDLAKLGAQTPIQGDLAQGQAATARATALTAEPNAHHQLFKNRQTEQDVAYGLVGDSLAELFKNGSAPDAVMKWQREIVPYINSRLGPNQQLPDWLVNANPQQLMGLASTLQNDLKHRQTMEKTRFTEEQTTARNDADNTAILDREDKRNQREERKGAQERYTEAQRKREMFTRGVQLYTQNALSRFREEFNRDPSPEEMQGLQHQAELAAWKESQSSGSMARAESGVAREAGEQDIQRDLYDYVSARRLPMKKGDKGQQEIDFDRLDPRALYKFTDPKTNTEVVGRWDRAKQRFVEARRQRPPQ